ncbi:ABC transporter permease [Devriesea agamarum]|uniref:ABC transporter permease n=1 Tax=Devriesea agamarum TaxID=472569 RepID=UPI00071DE1A0|nr:ABC transporter permease [Devriesea agamarum]
MTFVLNALSWIFAPANQTGVNGIWNRLWEHFWYTVIAVAITCLVMVPLGWLIGHTRKGRGLAVAATGAARSLPTLGLITLFALLLPLGLMAPMLAFIVLAAPSVLAGAYTGIEAVPRVVVDTARAQGMTEWQILWRVEIPLGLPLLIGGIRSAVLQVVATATLAAYVGAGGLGRYVFLGLKTQDYTQMLAGSILVVALAVVLEVVLLILQRVSRPGGVDAR